LLASHPGAEAPDADRAVAQDAALGVRVLRVEEAPGFSRRRVYTGRVEPFRQSDLGFERAGLLAEVLVREGDRVEAGQVLARLDPALIEAGRAELVAALRGAEADLALAEATRERYQATIGQGAVTRQALDEAREGARSAAAALELARARIASVDLDLEKAELRAPFPGVITGRDADEGRVLAAGEPVIRLQEARAPEIRVAVAGPLADALTPGAEHQLTWRGQSFPARLRAVLPLRAGVTRTLDALFEPLDPGTAPQGALRPGEQLELELDQWVDEPGIWLPLEALTEGARGLWSAYAVEPVETVADPQDDGARPSVGGRLGVRPLEILYQKGDRVFVRGTLAAGELLVATGLHRVVPGQLVRVLGAEGIQVVANDRRP
jgi:RND family efflux transporter MFP subunit